MRIGQVLLLLICFTVTHTTTLLPKLNFILILFFVFVISTINIQFYILCFSLRRHFARLTDNKETREWVKGKGTFARPILRSMNCPIVVFFVHYFICFLFLFFEISKQNIHEMSYFFPLTSRIWTGCGWRFIHKNKYLNIQKTPWLPLVIQLISKLATTL